MDKALARLERRCRESPDDRAAARALDRALIRAGFGARVAERVREKYLCRSRWLSSVDLERSRCWDCGRDLACARGVDDALRVLGEGGSVVVARDDMPDVLRRAAFDGELHSADELDAPCAAIAGASPIDSPLARRLLAEAATGAAMGPLTLGELEVDVLGAEYAWASPAELAELALPAPPRLEGARPFRGHDAYDALRARGARVPELELLHDALLHCRDAWSMEEYVRLSAFEGIDDYNSLDLVAAMVLLVAAGTEMPVLV